MPCVAVSDTDPPGQKVVAPLAVIDAEGILFTVIVFGADTLEQVPLFTVTLY